MADQEGGWSLRVFRMAVGDKYPKPYCAIAERKIGPKKREVFNVEGKTAEEAERLAKKQIQMKDLDYDNRTH